MTVRLRLGGAQVVVPEDWEIGSTEVTGDLVFARGPEHGSRSEAFRANAVLVREDIGAMDFSAWQDAVDDVVPSALDDYLLVDLEHREVADRPGGRRLAHHVDPAGRAVVMEQWFTCAGRIGYTVTVTVDVHRYDLLADLVARIGDSLEIDAAGAA